MWDTIVSTIQGIVGLPGDVGKGVAMAGTIWATLTDYRMWRSLGWILLGIVSMVLGVVLWNRRAIGSAIRTSGAITQAGR